MAIEDGTTRQMWFRRETPQKRKRRKEHCTERDAIAEQINLKSAKEAAM
jgi:hypothetical protein